MKQFFFFLLLSSSFFYVPTTHAQDSVEGSSEIGQFVIHLNPNRGVKGASYIIFESVATGVNISTIKNNGSTLIAISLKTEKVLLFEVLENNQIAVFESKATKKWPNLINHQKAEALIGKPISYDGDSYKKAVELFVALLEPAAKRKVKKGQKIIWTTENLTYYGQVEGGKANGTGEFINNVSNQLYLSCDNFVDFRCHGNGAYYDLASSVKVYEGALVNSNYEGRGKQWIGKDYFEGNFIANNKKGPFTITSVETEENYGFVAKGEFKNNKQEGAWLYKYTNGAESEIVFLEGEFVSKRMIKEASPTKNVSTDTEFDELIQDIKLLSHINISSKAIYDNTHLVNSIKEAFSRTNSTPFAEDKIELKVALDLMFTLVHPVSDSGLELEKALKSTDCQNYLKLIKMLLRDNAEVSISLDELIARTRKFLSQRYSSADSDRDLRKAFKALSNLIEKINLNISTFKQSSSPEFKCSKEEVNYINKSLKTLTDNFHIVKNIGKTFSKAGAAGKAGVFKDSQLQITPTLEMMLTYKNKIVDSALELEKALQSNSCQKTQNFIKMLQKQNMAIDTSLDALHSNISEFIGLKKMGNAKLLIKQAYVNLNALVDGLRLYSSEVKKADNPEYNCK